MAARQVTARIATNGSLIDADVLRSPCASGRWSSPSKSASTRSTRPLYAETHGTSPDMLDRVLGALRLMQENGFHTTVSTRLSPETLGGIPGLLDRALAEGWSTVTVHIPVHTHRTDGAYAQDSDALSVLAPVFDHFVALPKRWLIETYIPWAQYHPVMVRLAERVRIVHKGCGAGRDRLAIHPDGAISPCVCMDVPQARMGNVRTDDLADVFENSPICQLLRHPEGHGLCADCPQVAVCGGGCRAAAIAMTGLVDGEDAACPLRHSRARAVEAGRREH